jgi:hypothetical protein
MASLTIHTCPKFKRMSTTDQDYKSHLKNRMSYSSLTPKRDHTFTIELGRSEPIKTSGFSATVPETVVSCDRHAESSSESTSVTVTSDTLLGAMKKTVRERGIETFILTAIAEGDDDLATAYSNLSIGSMGPYISGVKDQIIEMVSQVKASGCKIVGLPFVGYKDWCDDMFSI